MKDLMFIAIAAISLSFVSNAFGQNFDHNPKPKSVRKGTMKKPASVRSSDVATGQSSGIKAGRTAKGTSGSSSRTRKPAPNSFYDASSPYLLKNAKSDSSSRTAKQPRKRSVQKRQYKP